MSPQEQFDEAIRLEDEGHQELALGVWQQLTETHPTRNALLRLGGITKELGLLEDAERTFKRVLEIDARSALAMRELGILAIDRRDYDIAESYLKEGLRNRRRCGRIQSPRSSADESREVRGSGASL